VALALIGLEQGTLTDFAGQTLEEMQLDPDKLGMSLLADTANEEDDVSDGELPELPDCYEEEENEVPKKKKK
jgi:hypothetical protein